MQSEGANWIVGKISVNNFCYNLHSTKFKCFLIYGNPMQMSLHQLIIVVVVIILFLNLGTHNFDFVMNVPL